MKKRRLIGNEEACSSDDHDRSVTRSARRIVIVAVPPVRTLDVFGPAEVFGEANDLHGRDPVYQVEIVSATTDRIVSSHIGTPVHTNRTYGECHGPIDTLLVAGGMGARDMQYERAFLQWLRDRSISARRFGSICTGAFVLAEAGLLDGRRATTHWNWANELATIRAYASIRIRFTFATATAIHRPASRLVSTFVLRSWKTIWAEPYRLKLRR